MSKSLTSRIFTRKIFMALGFWFLKTNKKPTKNGKQPNDKVHTVVGTLGISRIAYMQLILRSRKGP